MDICRESKQGKAVKVSYCKILGIGSRDMFSELAVRGWLRYGKFMRTTNDTVQKTIPANEIKRRGLSVIDKALKKGPVHVLKNNEPAYVIMAEDQYRKLVKRYRKSYLNRICRSLKDLKQGRVRPHTAQTLIDELHLEA